MMIVELREYIFKPGKVKEYFDLVQAEALELQVKHLGAPVGYYATDIGPQSQVIHMWAFADYADRERRRDALDAEPAWKAFQPKSAALVQSYETKILTPAPFYTPKR
jgi:NIPSNAP